MFDLGKGVVSTYISGSKPKIDTIQRICEHFQISIDDFINRDLSKGGSEIFTKNMQYAAESGGNETSVYIIQKLEETLAAKEEVIAMQRQRIKELEDRLNETTSGKRQAG